MPPQLRSRVYPRAHVAAQLTVPALNASLSTLRLSCVSYYTTTVITSARRQADLDRRLIDTRRASVDRFIVECERLARSSREKLWMYRGHYPAGRYRTPLDGGPCASLQRCNRPPMFHLLADCDVKGMGEFLSVDASKLHIASIHVPPLLPLPANEMVSLEEYIAMAKKCREKDSDATVGVLTATAHSATAFVVRCADEALLEGPEVTIAERPGDGVSLLEAWERLQTSDAFQNARQWFCRIHDAPWDAAHRETFVLKRRDPAEGNVPWVDPRWAQLPRTVLLRNAKWIDNGTRLAAELKYGAIEIFAPLPPKPPTPPPSKKSPRVKVPHALPQPPQTPPKLRSILRGFLTPEQRNVLYRRRIIEELQAKAKKPSTRRHPWHWYDV